MVLIAQLGVMSYSTADYVIQGLLLLLTVILPLSLRINPGCRASCLSSFLTFSMPFLLGCVWGFWRMIYYDPATNNRDYAGPGIIFVVYAFVLGFVSTLLFSIRVRLLHWRAKRSNKS